MGKWEGETGRRCGSSLQAQLLRQPVMTAEKMAVPFALTLNLSLEGDGGQT